MEQNSDAVEATRRRAARGKANCTGEHEERRYYFCDKREGSTSCCTMRDGMCIGISDAITTRNGPRYQTPKPQNRFWEGSREIKKTPRHPNPRAVQYSAAIARTSLSARVPEVLAKLQSGYSTGTAVRHTSTYCSVATGWLQYSIAVRFKWGFAVFAEYWGTRKKGFGIGKGLGFRTQF